MRKAIISFANERGLYVQRLARLSESLRNNFDGDFLGFIGEASCGAEPHETNPYNFKVRCWEKAIEAGYDLILWLDSSCFAVKNVDPVFKMIEEKGYVAQESGHFLGTWANDKSLEHFGFTRDEAMNIKMVGNAGLLGLNMRNGSSREFLLRWKGSMVEGIFKGAWNNDEKTESEDERCKGHRHDMVCSSAILHKMRLNNLLKGDEVLQYAGPYDEVLNNTIIFKAQG